MASKRTISPSIKWAASANQNHSNQFYLNQAHPFREADKRRKAHHRQNETIRTRHLCCSGHAGFAVYDHRRPMQTAYR